MADIDIKRAHKLGLKAARAAADQMAEHLSRKFGQQGDWKGNVLEFERPGVTGSLAVNEKDVRLTVSLGMLLRMMRASIEHAAHEEMDKLFSTKPAPEPSPKGRGASTKKASPRPKKGG